MKNHQMIKREPTPAQARYRMRFTTHAVPDPAPKVTSNLNRFWLGKAMAFVAVFSLIFTSIAPVGADDSVAPTDPGTDSSVTAPDASTHSTDGSTPTDETTDQTPPVDSPKDQAPVVEKAAVISWSADGDTQTTDFPVESGVVYEAPQNSQVTVTFTKLPDNPGKLSIKEITLTDEERDSIGATSNIGYDITSDMADGTFAYNLSLPAGGSNVQIAYTENSDALENIQPVESESVVADGVVSASALDHFTFFIPILIPKIQVDDICTNEPGVYRSWQVTNNKNTNVNLTWKIYNVQPTPPYISPASYTGTVTVAANSTITFDTPAVPGFNFILITGGGLLLPLIHINNGDNCSSNPPICGTDLVSNGSFEVPEVTTTQKWNIFDTGSNNIDWKATWNGGSTSFGSGTRPALAKIELQENGVVGGWNAQDGNQYTELDTDWDGPTGSLNGEPSSINLYQYIPTINGETYTVTFWTSARPDQGAGQSVTAFGWGGTTEDTISESGTGSTLWTKHTYSLVATGAWTKLSFTDMGTPDSLGGFVDNVSVKQDCVSTVKICKYNEEHQPLAGWTVFLKGAPLETVNVPSTSPLGASSVNNLASGQQYVLDASGTWGNRGTERVDAKFTSLDNWTNHFDAPQGGYPDNLLELQLNEGFVNWGPYSSTHDYSYITTGTDAPAAFRVYDFQSQSDADADSTFWYGDNFEVEGGLKVKISPVYSGVTDETGCTTIKNVPYGTYTLDELMSEGWVNIEGQGDTVVVNQSQEGFGGTNNPNDYIYLVNKCEADQCQPPTPVVPKLHLIKVICDQYSDVKGNENADEFDHTPDQNYTGFNNYSNGEFNLDYLVNNFVNPQEIPSQEAGCHQADNWQFLLTTDQQQNPQGAGATTVTTVNGEYVTPISGGDSGLSAELQAGIHNGNFWVSEVEQSKNYNFAALRCYDDVLYGDNLEKISIGDGTPTDIYCIAYNIDKNGPCIAQDPAIASGPNTLFKGLTETDPATTSGLDNPTSYPNGTPGAAVAAGPTGFPGAWDGGQNDPDITEGGGIWVNNEATQPTNPAGGNPGENGAVDTWRLFTHTFTIPGDATSLSTGVLHFAADNHAVAFLDGVQIGTSDSFTTPTDTTPQVLAPGTHTLKFAVKNDAFEPQNNPTGLIYNFDFTYCGSDTTQGETHYHATGMKWNDHNGNGSKDEGDNGIKDWNIYLTRKLGSTLNVDSSSSTGTNTPVLQNGKTYLAHVTGTFDAGDNIMGDAQYSERNSSPNWTDLVQNYESYGPTLLDLQVNGSFIDWGAYNSSHSYWTTLTGNGSAANFTVYDVFYPNNVGSLNVDLYEVIDSTKTDSNGNYDFEVTGLDGDLSIVEGMETGWNQTSPSASVYTVPGNANSNSSDFSNQPICNEQVDKPILKDIEDFIINSDDSNLPDCGNGISGTKYNTQEQTLPGWVIYLDLNNNGSLDNGEPYDTTDQNGNYSFSNLPTGTYHVREVGQSGWTQTSPGGDGGQTVEVLDSDFNTGINFVNQQNPNDGGDTKKFSISGLVYHDNDSQNGNKDSGEDGLGGWVVYVDLNHNGSLDVDEPSATSDGSGNYTIPGLEAGCYTVREVLQGGFEETEPIDAFYVVGIGDAPCEGATVTLNSNSPHWYDSMIHTASAAAGGLFVGNATGLDFGNNEHSNGGSSSGSRSNGSSGGSTPQGQILGDSTDVPFISPPGQVLGATTDTLPVTGLSFLVIIIMLLAAPVLYSQILVIKKNWK